MRFALIVMLGACGFQINTGATVDDGGAGDDATTDDGATSDTPIDGMTIDGDPHPGWWNASWMHRRKITLDTSRFTGAVTDFPVLVRLPALTGTLATGNDLRFVSSDGQTVYPYELDSFNAAGTSFVWVKMTLSNQADTELWVYYGNALAPTVSSGTMVFAGNHVSVHHMGSLLDATGNTHTAGNGVVASVPTTNLTGRVGAARTFDGNDDSLTLANSNAAYDFTTEMYASAWVKVAGFEDAYQAIITKGDSSWRMARANNTNGVAFGWTSGGTNDNLNGTDSIAGPDWHHVAIVKTPTAKLVYVDGMKDEELANNAQLDNNDLNVRFGMNEESTTGGQRYWHGDIDEVRISETSRNAAWVFAEFVTTDPTFTTVGADEPY